MRPLFSCLSCAQCPSSRWRPTAVDLLAPSNRTRRGLPGAVFSLRLPTGSSSDHLPRQPPPRRAALDRLVHEIDDGAADALSYRLVATIACHPHPLVGREQQQGRVALGEKRSIRSLHRELEAEGEKIGYRHLRNWSKANNWVEISEGFDRGHSEEADLGIRQARSGRGLQAVAQVGVDEPPRPLEEIESDLQALEQEIAGLFSDVVRS